MEYTASDVEKAITSLSATITKCENIQHKFAVGKSQHSLVTNRIRAFTLAKTLLTDAKASFTIEELERALAPVVSLLHKTTKAQSKYTEGSTQFLRFTPLIQAMAVAKAAIEDKIVYDIS